MILDMAFYPSSPWLQKPPNLCLPWPPQHTETPRPKSAHFWGPQRALFQMPGTGELAPPSSLTSPMYPISLLGLMC